MPFFFTPSRVAVIVLALSLLSFLWSFGLPGQHVETSLPLLNHDAPTQKVGEPVKTRPTPEFDRPYVPPGNPRHTPVKAPDAPNPKPNPKPTPKPPPPPPPPPPKPIESKVPEKEGSGDDKKGNVDDKEKDDAKAKEGITPTPAPVASALPPFPTTAAVNETAKAPADSPSTKFCKDVHGAPNVVVIVKTSKVEISGKLPTKLKTLLSCVPNFLIFSDHTGKVNDFTIHDALDVLSNSTMSSNAAFGEYKKMKQDPNYKPEAGKTKDLDKFKILPMIYKAHRMHPNSRWYIFIEPDTSISWTNLLQWVDRLDYRIPYYVGAPMSMNNVNFAQRGPGILLSYGAMKQYAKTYDERYESEWEKKVATECCGDMVLATALTQSHVEFYPGFPLLQGESPATLDWSDRHWCAPAVSWHHVSSPEIDSLWTQQTKWTTKNGWELPHLFRDAFEDAVMPHIQDSKDSWDNLSQDIKITGTEKKQREKEKAEKEKQEKEKEKKRGIKRAGEKPPTADTRLPSQALSNRIPGRNNGLEQP